MLIVVGVNCVSNYPFHFSFWPDGKPGGTHLCCVWLKETTADNRKPMKKKRLQIADNTKLLVLFCLCVSAAACTSGLLITVITRECLYCTSDICA
uniref:Uncharacterized protein n=1 Tax=Rhizophora mucronata TaxID=61149 RepID=A0A2P2N1J9_RHIMU